MTEQVSGITKINGNNGIYDNKIQNVSVRYGRNSANNYNKYLYKLSEIPGEDLDITKNPLKMNSLEYDKFEKSIDKMREDYEKLPSLNFEYKYLPGEVDYKSLDRMALLGAAFEEMGKKISIGVEEFTQKLQKAFGEKASAKALDLNNDNKIDVSEYATSMLVSDMLSTDESKLEATNIKGTVTNKGMIGTMPYINKNNYEIANKTYRAIHNAFKLNEAQEEFVSNPNNMQ